MKWIRKVPCVVVAFAIAQAGQASAGLAADPSLRLEADSGLVLDPEGRVTSWADLSGNGHDAVQGAEGSRPLAVSGVFNGVGAVRFDGANDFLDILGQVLTSQQYTIFAVVTDTSTSTGYREIFSNWRGDNTVTSAFLGTVNQDPVRVRFTDAFGGNASPDPGGVGQITDPTSPFLLSAWSDVDSVAVAQNGSTIASQGSPIPARDLTTPYALGRQGLLDGEYWSGDIAAILVYDRQLTESERAETTQYLMAKYLGIQVVPEPASVAMLAVGALGIACAARRRRVAA